ncbi:MAG TPA: 2-isopropylmalate synthase [Candidatus Binatia bacterium]|nr:2-isopropylmalate synthase [Candidatus Binatia bacterium]
MASQTHDERDLVWIFDTTLRDGEQSPGATMNVEEKLAIARQLEELGVDVIEAGFAASSEGDFAAVQAVAEALARPVVLSLARTKEADILRAVRAVEKAKRPGLHVFIATSDIHLKHKLMMSRQQVVEAAGWAVDLARKHLEHVEFSAEDASRSDRDYLKQVFGEAIRAGATVCNVPDTTGYAIPEQLQELFAWLRANVEGGERVRWSTHCHNDLGLAVSNSLAAVRGGARQVECTINGIGERAGNTSMEEVVMALDTRRDYFGLRTNIRTEHIYGASRLLSQVTGITVPINKPIVGENAFAHEAGIHQDGVLKYKLTYEIMLPEKIGRPSNTLVLGKHSGRAAFVDRLKTLGLFQPGLDVNKAFAAFKALADRKKNVYDEDLVAIVAEESTRVPKRYELLALDASSSTDRAPHARVRVRVGETEAEAESGGDGIVDATYNALAEVVTRHGGRPPTLERYAVKAITGGTDAQGEVSCLLRDADTLASGQGSHTDILMASALAYLVALNKLEYLRTHRATEPVAADPGP